jgi:hypothetical protein
MVCLMAEHKAHDHYTVGSSPHCGDYGSLLFIWIQSREQNKLWIWESVSKVSMKFSFITYDKMKAFQLLGTKKPQKNTDNQSNTLFHLNNNYLRCFNF